MGWNNKRGKNKDSYQFVVFLGRSKDGKKKEVRKTVNLSHITSAKKRDMEAQKMFAIWENEVKGGNYLKSEKISFQDFTEKWLNHCATPNIQPKTLLEYKNLLKRINYSLGHIKLVNINPEILINFYNNLKETGIRMDKKYVAKKDFSDIISSLGYTFKDIKNLTGVADSVIRSLKNRRNIQYSSAQKISNALKINTAKIFDEVMHDRVLSDNTIHHYHRLINIILNYAVELGYLTSNPASKISRKPKLPRTNPRYFDLKEAVAILLLLKNQPIKYRLMVTLSFFTGMRESEIAALTWDDINLKTGIISVSKSLQYIPRNGISIKSTKTGETREVGVPQSVINLFIQYKNWQNSEKENLGDLWHDSNQIFTSPDGNFIHPSTIGKWFLNFQRKHNKLIQEDSTISKEERLNYLLPEVNFHGIRHTNATLLNSMGIAISRISKQLGHKKISTTTDIYTHFSKEFDTELVQVLENLLGDSI